ncbi:MAG TPA: pitrilysin family protein [Longimicrobiales bacterium]|nr:pitrilysin family protein [Longimicrobiales bacterium]
MTTGEVRLDERPGRLAESMSWTELGNGVQVMSEHIPGVRSAAVGVWVRQGSAHEPEADAGMSHMLEHMVFKGTERRTAAEIAVALEGLGGSLDAYTSREHTSYQARVLDEHLPEALDVLADLVLAPRLEASDLALEHEVVLEEIAQVEDTPDDLVFELHSERLWRGHPYGRSILGTKESVSAMTADRLRDLHGGRYVGANFVVAGAGNLEHEDFARRVGELFGGVRTGAGRGSVEAPVFTGSGIEQSRRDSAQTHIVFGTDVPGHSHPDRYALVLVSSALGAGMSSRLFQRVREELALCYSIYTYQSFYSRSGVTGVYVGTRPATATTAAAAVREELTKVAAKALPEAELEQVKRQLKGQIVLSLESSGARLHRLASFALHEEPVISLSELLAKIDAVSLDDVTRVAGEYFEPVRQLELRLGPE